MRAFISNMLAVLAVGAGGCVHAQTGPLIGVSSKHGPVVGWEAGAGVGMLSGSLGVEARPFGERIASFYAAGEPAVAVPIHDEGGNPPDRFLSTGGTVGAAIDERGEKAWLVGGWAGVPWIASGDCRETTAHTASISIGVHVFIGAADVDLTFYASPKLGVLTSCPSFGDSIRAQ